MIVNLLSAIPVVGGWLVVLVLGDVVPGLSVLPRILVVHVVLPLVLVVGAGFHVILIHRAVSVTTLGLTSVFSMVKF